MTMTSLGKTLVMLNVALSLAMATWAQSIYSTRIDWSDNKGKEGAPDGELRSRLARLSELGNAQSGALNPAVLSWNDTRASLLALDARRVSNQAWYDKELAFNRTTASKTNPAHVVKLQNGQPAPGKPGTNDPVAIEPGLDPFGQPLQSLAAYAQAEASLYQQIEGTTKNLAKLIEEDIRLTNEIAGDGATIKGLQQRILDGRTKMAAAIEEQHFVRPLLINAVVNSDLVFRRQRALESRIKELEKVGVALK
jgi:hypothetical protein